MPSTLQKKNVFRRKPSNLKPVFQQCNRQGCTNHIQVYLCTGSNYAHHRGHWYEACVNESDPSDMHFVTWRTDIPPRYVGDLVRHEVRGVLPNISPSRKGKMSMQALINQYTEEHPFSPFPPSPARHSPVKRGQVALDSLFDFSQSIEIPDHVLSEEESLQFSKTLDRVEAEMEAAFSNIDVGGIQILQEALQRGLRNEQNSQHPVSAQLFNWQIGQTEQRLVNGALRKCCLGRGCAGKLGLKSNYNCSYKLCKGCCIMYQQEMSTPCKEAGHKPSKGSSTIAPSSSLYVHTRPLQPLHYERREQAHLDYHNHSRSLQNQQIFANDVKKNFWDESEHMDMLTVESPTHPYFCINNCSAAVCEALGATDGKLVRIFDLQTRSWVLEESSNKRFVHDGECLLVRPRHCSMGVGMQDAEEEEINRLNPRKRKLQDTLDAENNFTPVTPSRRIASYSKTPSAFPSIKPDPTTSESIIVLSPSLSPTRIPAPIRDLSDSPDLPSMVLPTPRPSTPSPAPKVKKAKLLKTEAEDEEINFTIPNSRHAAWPWKFYRGMHDGFVQIDKKGLKHNDVFPSTTAQTKALARTAWNAGTPELKDRFYSDQKNTWKAYVNAVKELYGGTIPSHSALKKSKLHTQVLAEAGPSNLKRKVIEID
ncbi:hypothetical protein C8R42DRAFT_640252 [Lentinula raphanica]|nr:hypothetical protein C8R42DRAFT_640252 [Lentinula raphanica]